MPGNKKENRSGAEGHDHRVGESPGHAQIDEQKYHGKEIAEQPIE